MGVIATKNFLVEHDLETQNRSTMQQMIEYTSKTSGARSVLRLMRSAAKLANYFHDTPNVIATNIDKASAGAASVLGIVRLPATTQEAYQAIVKVHNKDQVPVERKILVAARDTLDAVSSWCGAAIFIASHSLLRQLSQIADLGSDSADLYLTVNDYSAAVQYEAASTGVVKEAFTHTRKYKLLCLIKNVMAVAAAVFGVITLVTGLSILPLVISLILSLATASLAIRRDLWKEEGRYKIIDLSAPILL